MSFTVIVLPRYQNSCTIVLISIHSVLYFLPCSFSGTYYYFSFHYITITMFSFYLFSWRWKPISNLRSISCQSVEWRINYNYLCEAYSYTKPHNSSIKFSVLKPLRKQRLPKISWSFSWSWKSWHTKNELQINFSFLIRFFLTLWKQSNHVDMQL